MNAVKPALLWLVRLDPAPVQWDVGVRFALGCGLPPVVGIATGYPAAGVIAAFGALFALLSDIGGSLSARLTLMLSTTLCMTAGAVIGTLATGHFWFTAGLIGAAAFVAAWVMDLDRQLELVARFAAVSIVIGNGVGVHDPRAAVAFCAGGLFASLLVFVGYWRRRAQSEPAAPSWGRAFGMVLTGRSVAGFRFAACYAAVAVLAVAATQTLGLQRGFWITITALFVMRPDGIESVKLMTQRLIGTVAGVGAAALVVQLAHAHWALAGWVLVFGLFAPLGIKRNYALGVGLVTAMAMVLLDLSPLSAGGEGRLLWIRVADTLIGCLLAFAGTLAAYPELLLGSSTAQPPRKT
jgi:Fusaric acid resistance protein-like